MKNLIKKSGLNIENSREQIEAVLTEVNGIRGARWTADYSDIASIAKEAEEELKEAGLSESARVGAVVRHPGFCPAAKAYRYSVRTTSFTIKRTAKGWNLMSAAEAHRYPDSRRDWKVSLSDRQARLIAQQVLGTFEVSPFLFSEQAVERGYLVHRSAVRKAETPAPDLKLAA